jgi:hypothetical protein
VRLRLAVAAAALVAALLVPAASAQAGDVRLAWDPSPDAAVVGYIVYFGLEPGNYPYSVDVGAQTTYVISNLVVHARLYFIVRGYTADRQLSAPSNEVSGLAGFTDHPLVPGVHQMRQVHFTEMRARLDTLRIANGLPPYEWLPLAAGSLIGSAHVSELRSAIYQVYQRRNLPFPSFTDPTLASRFTMIRAVHINELRAAILALE